MPGKRVKIPDIGYVTFPDSMSLTDIQSAIENDILKKKPEPKLDIPFPASAKDVTAPPATTRTPATISTEKGVSGAAEQERRQDVSQYIPLVSGAKTFVKGVEELSKVDYPTLLGGAIRTATSPYPTLPTPKEGTEVLKFGAGLGKEVFGALTAISPSAAIATTGLNIAGEAVPGAKYILAPVSGIHGAITGKKPEELTDNERRALEIGDAIAGILIAGGVQHYAPKLIENLRSGRGMTKDEFDSTPPDVQKKILALPELASTARQFQMTPEGVGIEKPVGYAAEQAASEAAKKRVAQGKEQLKEPVSPQARFASDIPEGELPRQTKPFEEPPTVIGDKPKPVSKILTGEEIASKLSEGKEPLVVGSQEVPIDIYKAEQQRTGILSEAEKKLFPQSGEGKVLSGADLISRQPRFTIDLPTTPTDPRILIKPEELTKGLPSQVVQIESGAPTGDLISGARAEGEKMSAFMKRLEESGQVQRGAGTFASVDKGRALNVPEAKELFDSYKKWNDEKGERFAQIENLPPEEQRNAKNSLIQAEGRQQLKSREVLEGFIAEQKGSSEHTPYPKFQDLEREFNQALENQKTKAAGEIDQALGRLSEEDFAKHTERVQKVIFNARRARGIKPAMEGGLQAAVVPGLKEFFDQDVLPNLNSLGIGAKETFNLLRALVAPRGMAGRAEVDTMMKHLGERNKALFMLDEATKGIRKMFDKTPINEKIDFIDNQKTGGKQATPELQEVADFYRKTDDDLFVAVNRELLENIDPKSAAKVASLSDRERLDFFQKLSEGTAQSSPSLQLLADSLPKIYQERMLDYLNNHFRLIWKVRPGSLAKGKELFLGTRRPLSGSKGFFRHQIFNTLSEGMDEGGIPATFNPQVLFERSYADAMKFITAQRMFRSLKDQGKIIRMKPGDRPPEGWSKPNDRMFNIYFKGTEGMVHAGDWYMENNAARLLNNHLSHDYIRETALGRGLMGVKNITTAVELGLSPFHAIFETIESSGSNIALGMRKLFVPGYRLEGLKDIALSPFSPAEVARLGSVAKKAFANKAEFMKSNPEAFGKLQKAFPDFDRLMDMLFTGGGKLSMSEDYRYNTIRSFNESLQQNNYVGAVLRSIPALNQTLLSPLFEHYIPSLKVGTFLKEMNWELIERANDLKSGKLTEPELAREVWDFVENRFGEMNFDNLFWDRTFKTAMQFNFRSVTWKLGNIRAFGDAAQQLKEVSDAIKEKRAPRLQRNFAWILGMTLTTSAISSIVSKATTGKYPWELAKDMEELAVNMVFPRVDVTDDQQRVSVPTYWRDMVSISKSVPEYIKHSMSGEIGRFADVLQNRDYYGVNVYDPDAKPTQQAFDILKHFVPLPFSMQSLISMKQSGQPVGKQMMGFMGFTKAPRYISEAPFETRMRELLQRRGEFTYTKEEGEQKKFTHEFVDKFQSGEFTDQDIDKAMKMGLFDQSGDFTDNVKQQLALTPAQRMFKRLSVEDALDIFDQIPEDRIPEFIELLNEKMENAANRKQPYVPAPIEQSQGDYK